MNINIKIVICIVTMLCSNTEIMSNHKKEQQTIEFYNQTAEQWVEKYGPDAKETFWTNELKAFNTLLPCGKILEVGVGGGREATELIKMGYEYIGIDPASNLISLAQQRFPHAKFFVQNACYLDFPRATFDGFWCAAVFIHIPKNALDTSLQNIQHTMKPGALGFISLAEGLGEYLDKKTGRWFFLHTAKEFADALKRNGFNIESQATRSRNSTHQWLQSWLTFFVRKES